ncbi:MAG: hypothetical protein LBG06_06745 [Deltaproteobacteria bacterium]|nr:hypothetical protein [Deltaproteobacteria bacterium]
MCGIEIAGGAAGKTLRFTVDRLPLPAPSPRPLQAALEAGAADASVPAAPVTVPAAASAASLRTSSPPDPPDGRWRGSAVTLDDCAGLSPLLSDLLDGLWPGDGPAYVLEVSSPGLDRPLNSEAEFVRFSGSLAKLKLRRDGRTLALTGRLRCSPGALSLLPSQPGPLKPGKARPEPEPVSFAWEEVTRARLVPEL